MHNKRLLKFRKEEGKECSGREGERESMNKNENEKRNEGGTSDLVYKK